MPLAYLGVAIVVGSVAFRMCLNGIGWGSSPSNAILASVVTSAMAFILMAIVGEGISLRGQIVMCGLLSFVSALIHIVAFLV